MQPDKTLGFGFPGQGSQYKGMLQESAAHFPIIEAIFKQASDSAGIDLWKIAQQGPEADLNSTINTQPILLAAGVALWKVWEAKNGRIPKIMAGHSLGEYTALVCAQALTLEDGIKLVKQRAQFMQEAVPQGQGGMAAILGLDNTIIKQICDETENRLKQIVAPANYNAIGQTVIAGDAQAVTEASILAKENGGKAIPLPVSVPSHCALMKSASEKLAQVLSGVEIKSPQIAIIQNANVEILNHPDDIREQLVKQLYQPVRWVETMQRFKAEGIQNMVECGPGKVLSTLLKRTEPSIKAYPIESVLDLEAALGV